MFDLKITPARWIIDEFTEKPNVLLIFKTSESLDILRATDRISDELRNHLEDICALPYLLEVYKAAVGFIKLKGTKKEPECIIELTDAIIRLANKHGERHCNG